ncbi:MAG: glutathione S-transferase N-terminal domain-containing protein [Nitrospirales bacterium]
MSVNLNKMKLYHTEWCPECEAVRQKLTELGFPYEDEIVPDVRPFRKKVYEVSGQYYVPVLVHGETVLTETFEILAYLDNYEDHGQASGVDRQETSNPPFSTLDERNH